jgi:hypothetical protein
MRYLVVNDDASADDLREAITHLRAKQRRACIQSTRDELDADISELLDLLAVRVEPPPWMDRAR